MPTFPDDLAVPGARRPARTCRVLRIVGELNFGGTEMRTAELLPRLAAAGVEVHLVTLSERIGPGPLAETVTRHGGTVTPIALDAHFAPRLIGLLRRLRPDVVHVDCANFSGVPLALARLRGVPVRVAHFRGDDNLRRSLRRRVYRRLCGRLLQRSATDILGVSPSALTFGYDRAWQDDPRCRVVLNGLDLDRLRAPGRDDLRALVGAEPGALVCVSVGRASPEKRRWLLPPILAELRALGVSAHAVLVGPGDDADDDARVRAAARAAGLADRVHLIGPRDDVGDLLRQADVVVHPSCLEGLPGGVLEPVALGIGAVAADLPGVRFIEAHLPGVTVVDTDAPPRAWAEAVRTAAAYTAATTPETAAARFADSIFAIDAAAAAHLAIYRPEKDSTAQQSRLTAGSER
ncbi:glycosyltransferase family 4 protein [Micromonospora craniellae]|uniref:Glycosyltransferase n=1 Tax=Micromonospora craniellae TaxID=2294034 RepID=A0A372G1J1_9ACTN|nr:glycosyltransferase family 4 protein [Micromonospora craniellae]QOC92744.1 glycosyltransferase family 4 protein [Micromonospora craniellae]RFS46892.1 glycosyltransferase [Micromonospora craniellae]